MVEEIHAKAMRLHTEDFKTSLNFGTFGGRIDVSIFSSGPNVGGPIIKMLLNDKSAYQFILILKKIVDDPEAKPIELGFYPFNRDTKVNEFRGSITAGRDQDKAIYLDVVGDRHKEPLRFFLLGDRTSIKINGMDMPRQSYSETCCKSLIRQLETMMDFLVMNPSKPPPNNQSSFSSNEPPPPAVGEDIPF